MKRRYFLFTVIGLMCVIVIILGNIIFVKSNGILKRSVNTLPSKVPDDLVIFIDITENKMLLVSEGQTLKTYPIASGKYDTPSPIGDWTIVSKDTWGGAFGGYWLGLDIPWGTYGIHGTTNPQSIGKAVSHGCIRMYNEDVKELYNFVKHGTHVKIYGGLFGSFGNGFRVLEPGDSGSDVYEVQKWLKRTGYYKGYVNGIYNKEMEHAVHEFQKKNELPISNSIGYRFYNKLGISLFE